MRKKAKYVFMKKIKVKEYVKRVEKTEYKTDLNAYEDDEDIFESYEQIYEPPEEAYPQDNEYYPDNQYQMQPEGGNYPDNMFIGDTGEVGYNPSNYSYPNDNQYYPQDNQYYPNQQGGYGEEQGGYIPQESSYNQGYNQDYNEYQPFNPDNNPIYPDNNPIYPDNNPIYPDNNPIYPDNNPIYPDNNPIYPDNNPIYPDNQPLNPNSQLFEEPMFSDDLYDTGPSDLDYVEINPSNAVAQNPTVEITPRINAAKVFNDSLYVNNTAEEDEHQYNELDYIKNRNKNHNKPSKSKSSKSSKSEQVKGNSVVDESLYDDKKKVRLKNTDGLDTLTIARNFRVTRKEALTSIEAKTPFIVGKMDDKHPSKSKAIIEEHDIVYRTIPKIKHSEFKASQRVGYLQVSDKPSYQPFNRKKTKHILGIINDEYIITKKKASNQRKIGYVRLEDDDSGIDKYIEVTKKKSTPFLLILFIIIGILLFIKNFDSIEDWHVDFSRLNVYKTEEQLEYNQSVVTINHSAEATLNNNQVKLNLKGNINTGISNSSNPLVFKVTLRDPSITTLGSPLILYESELLEPGTVLQNIPINYPYETGEYEIEIICDSYNADTNSFIGSIDSSFKMVVE